ncbi:hypothetical protein CC1G_06937 [Coprinopsis cinerea okayama7|uniref:Yeast cell wall synthesis Kre9/Knh1-like N-terminal domain-containing protein n=1 Tax=Coprinopsis cinerea (strain Okayama-7 / 130 / ATCC MYA-4618 / FGSC 9003) TaxID=240176 RepID=A8NZR6_COPC7|nr:hypothetical protein CC1G_06937 [Coprinopsis cinerea okayama7\|eukprot:XP_001837731.2 hypothetical protein CC1G_06937 [Coprinopsis cinerea okayama7\
MFTKAFVLLAIASQAFATVFITNPVATSTLVGGEEATISWIESGGGPSLEEFGPARISIYVGNAQQQTGLQVIAEEVDVSTTSSVSFTVDPSIGPDSDEYFIRVESLNLRDEEQPQYPALAFSAKFTLSEMTGVFTAEILDQIAGQSTAPLALPTAAAGDASAISTPTGSGAVRAASAASDSARPTSSGADDEEDDDEDGAAFTNSKVVTLSARTPNAQAWA